MPVGAFRKQIHDGNAFGGDLAEIAVLKGRGIPQHENAAETVENIPFEERLGAFIAVGDMDGEFEIAGDGGTADGHGGGGVGGGEVPGDDEEDDLVGVAALQVAPDGVGFVAESADGVPNALLGLLADAAGVAVVVEDVGNGGVGNIGFPRHVFNCRSKIFGGAHNGYYL